jgi:hypothetical protein
MDNQPSQDNQTPTSQQPITPPTQTVPPSRPTVEMNKQTNKKKGGGIALFITILFVLLVGGGAAYALLVYVPNKPENVFKKAIESFASNPGSYTATGKIDQGDNDVLDYQYSIKTSTNGDSLIEVNTTSSVQAPAVSVQKVNNKIYVKFDNFLDKAALAKRYLNNLQEGLQEYIAEFTEKSTIAANQNKWLLVDDYILQQPASTSSTSSTPNISDFTLSTIGSLETVNGNPSRKYGVTLSADAFNQFVQYVDKNAGVPLLNAISPASGLSVDSLNADVWVNTKTKTIEKINYSGRPFEDATFDLTLNAANNIFTAPESTKLTNVLGYGIVSSRIFNRNFQQGNSDNDRERIADLKGIKTALEIYKTKVGYYPERYDVSVDQDKLLDGLMAGVDKDLFKDPNGRYIGINGSQYAYVSSDEKGDEGCGKFAKPCTKYFISTTLDDGKQFQLNSD